MHYTIRRWGWRFATSLTIVAALSSICSARSSACPPWGRQQAQPVSSEAAFDWGEAGQRDFARRRLDPSQWNQEMLASDIAAKKRWPSSDNLMPYLPAPTVPYVSNGRLGFEKLQVGTGTAFVASLDWGCFDFNRELCGGRTSRNYCNVVILMSDPETIHRGGSMSSRAWPHIQARGYLETCIGDVTWTFTGYATGANYLNVNKHIFDLNLGRTVLVAPQKDGSLRFQQLQSPDRDVSADGDEPLAAFLASLATRASVRAFFGSGNAVDASTPSASKLLGPRAQSEQLQRVLDDWSRLHDHIDKLGDVAQNAIATFVAAEDRRIHAILLESIQRYGYPSARQLGSSRGMLLQTLGTPPFAGGPGPAREHLDEVAAVLLGVLEQNRQEARSYEAFQIEYEPALSSVAFARFYDSYVVKHLGGMQLYGSIRAEDGTLPVVRDLASTNAARAAIGLEALSANDVREMGGR